MSSKLKYQPVIIIGAPRSGTNMLRDLLVELPGVSTWPCDEINYIWRHGNVRYHSDEFYDEMATPSIKAYVRAQFDRCAKVNGSDVIVEKTCANSLRVGFVDNVIPDAKYIFIVRNGFDAVASASERWHARIDVLYLLKKVRYVPVVDLPYYASRYFVNQIYRVFSRSKRLAFWGPLLNGMKALLNQYSLMEVCAIQWLRCVERSEMALAKIASDRVVRVKYEDFVRNPVDEFVKIANFIGKDVPEDVKSHLLQNVNSLSVGKGIGNLESVQLNTLKKIINDAVVRYE